MKLLYLLTFIFTCWSCQNKPDTTSTTTALPTAQPQDTLTQVANVDDNFSVFLDEFNQNEDFQYSRVKFPLFVSTLDTEDPSKEIKQQINPNAYTVINLTYHESYATRTDAERYTQRVILNNNKVTIELRGVDNGLHTDYFFEKTNQKWYLVGWNNHSF